MDTMNAFANLYRRTKLAAEAGINRFTRTAEPWLTNKQIPWYFIYGTGLAPFGGDAFSIPRRSRARYERPSYIPIVQIRDFAQLGWPIMEVLEIRVASLPGGGEGSFPPHQETYIRLFEQMVQQGIFYHPFIQENPQKAGIGFTLLATVVVIGLWSRLSIFFKVKLKTGTLYITGGGSSVFSWVLFKMCV